MEASALLLATLRADGDGDRAQIHERWLSASGRSILHLAFSECCAVWLYRRLRDLGLFEVVDEELADALAARARLVEAQTLRIDAQRDAIVRLLTQHEIPFVLLKGSALRLLGNRIPYADARATGDVDILIQDEQINQVWDWLREQGFETSEEEKYRNHHHLPPLSNRLGVPVELHRSTSSAVAPEEAWRRFTTTSVEVTRGDVTATVPGPTELLWHALTHAVALGPQGFRLRYLQDAAVIMASQELDWETIRHRLSSSELLEPIVGQRWLFAAADLAGTTCAPRWLSAGPRFELRRALTWRALVTTRLIEPEASSENGTSGPDKGLRMTRLLIEEGTRADLGLSLTPPRWGKSATTRVGRRVAAGAARAVYLGWKSVKG